MRILPGLIAISMIAIGATTFLAADAQATELRKKSAAAKKNTVTASQGARPAAKPQVIPVARKVVRSPASMTLNNTGNAHPNIQSSAVAVIDQRTGALLYERNAGAVVPIASITKLMTAMVALDAGASLSEDLTISSRDVDTLKGTTSRLAVGTRLNRETMLHLALMSSENRAAAALSRYYPGGRPAFIAAMNAKARELGLYDTRFADATGLSPENVSSARDLIGLVAAATSYPLIREFSTSEEFQVAIRGQPKMFRNTNALVRNEDWQIGLSKTGYISEAGRCLVMQTWLDNRPTIIVLLDSWGKLTRIGDAKRIRQWLESAVADGTALSG